MLSPTANARHLIDALRNVFNRECNVSTEMSLNVLAYNLKRVTRILSFQQTMKAMLSMGAEPLI